MTEELRVQYANMGLAIHEVEDVWNKLRYVARGSVPIPGGDLQWRLTGGSGALYFKPSGINTTRILLVNAATSIRIAAPDFLEPLRQSIQENAKATAESLNQATEAYHQTIRRAHRLLEQECRA